MGFLDGLAKPLGTTAEKEPTARRHGNSLPAIDALCFYCGASINPPPQRNRKCPSCRQSIVIRFQPSLGREPGCDTGKACGNSCIARNLTCHQPPGCACDQ